MFMNAICVFLLYAFVNKYILLLLLLLLLNNFLLLILHERVQGAPILVDSQLICALIVD